MRSLSRLPPAVLRIVTLALFGFLVVALLAAGLGLAVPIALSSSGRK